MTVINITRRTVTQIVMRNPVTVITQGRGLMGFKGDQGDPAPNTIWQFSEDGATWSITIPENVLYMRESSDNGVTWTDAIMLPSAAQLALKANVSDVNTALALKAPLSSPALTGTPTAPTAPQGTNTNQIATTAYVFLATMEGDWA